ncbi:MAG: hypothetical protein RIT28_3481, partial [Pseudomonadota bacterium]
LPYTMWTYFGNIARYEGTEVNVFAPNDGVRAVAPTYNPETEELGFAQNDDGSLRQSVTVKEIESAETLVIFGIDPSSGEITIQDGVQYNLGMNKALSMANPTPEPAPEVQAPEVQAPEAQVSPTPAPEEVQLSVFDTVPGRTDAETATRDIGLSTEADTDGRKLTSAFEDNDQTQSKPDLSVTPPEQADEVVQPTVAQENVAAAPPSSPLFQQLRGIVASMLYDVPEAAPAIAETMGLSPEGLQILRDNDNVTNWAELTAAGLSDADRAALQRAAALKLVSTLDPDQPASLFLSWFDWHIGTQADFTITQPHLQNAINMDNAGMDEVAAVMGVANFKRLVLSTHGLPGGQIMKTEEGSGFNIYDARIMAELAERAGVNSVLLAHCYGALGADGVNTLDVDSRQASGSSIAEFSSRGMDVSAYEGAVNTRTATAMVGVWSELIAAGVPDEAALQLAGAFANATGGENLNNINWSQYVSHARAELGPEGDPQAWANRNGFVDTQIRGKRVGPEQILQLLTQYGDVLLATQGAQEAPKAWKGKIPENQVDLLARMTVNDLIYGGLYPEAGLTGADAQMVVTLLGQAWSGATLVQDGALPEWAVLGARLYFALEGQVAAIQHMDPAERAARANVLQNLQIMRDEVWIQLAAAGQGIIDAQGQIAFLPPTDLNQYATNDTTLNQSAAPAQVDGVTVADVTQIPGDGVSVDPDAPVQTLLFDLAEVGTSTTRSLPTPGLVGGVTTSAAPAPQGDDGQRRQEVLTEARAHFKPMMAALLSHAATRGTGARGDRALSGLTSAVSNQLDTFRRTLTMKGIDAAWVTTDVVLDMLARDTELARALQEATPGVGIEPGQLLTALDPAHRLAAQMKAAPDDAARLAALRDALHRLGGGNLLTGAAGGELIAELGRFKDPLQSALAGEMLRAGQVLEVTGEGADRKVERVTVGLDGRETREAAALVTELSLFASTLDQKNPASEQNAQRLAGTRARVARALRDLRDAKARLQDPNLSDADRQASEKLRDALLADARQVGALITSSGSLLSTLVTHDGDFYRDALVPYLAEVGLATQASAPKADDPGLESFLTNTKLISRQLNPNNPTELKRLLEEVIRQAEVRGADPNVLLAEFARRYSNERGSFYKLLTDAFNATSQSFSLRGGTQDTATLKAMLHAFGIERSAATDALRAEVPNARLTPRQEVELVQIVNEYATKLQPLIDGHKMRQIDETMQALRARLQLQFPGVLFDETTRTRVAQQAVRAVYRDRYGSMEASLMGKALQGDGTTGYASLGLDAQALAKLNEESNAMGFRLGRRSSTERLQAHYDTNPGLAQTRLPADKRTELFNKAGDTVGLIELILGLSPEERALLRGDDVLMGRIAQNQPAAWSFIRKALDGQLAPADLMMALDALKDRANLKLDPKSIVDGVKDGAAKVITDGKSILSQVIGVANKAGMGTMKEAGAAALRLIRGRLQPEQQKVLDAWVQLRRERLKAEDPALADNEDALNERLAQEALALLESPDFQALLRTEFTPEQRAAITSVALSGQTSKNDLMRQSGLFGPDGKNILSVLSAAYEAGKIAKLRDDPSIMGLIGKLPAGERQYALHMLFETPAAKALAVMQIKFDLSDKNAWSLVERLSTLSMADRDAIRDDPALVTFLSGKLNGEALGRFRALMQLNERDEALPTAQSGATDQDKQREWLRLRAVEGVKALIAAGDHRALLRLASDLYSSSVLDPASTPSFDQTAAAGPRAGDLSAADREAIASTIRASTEFQTLFTKSPTLAAAVMDGVLGLRDPAPVLYTIEVNRQITAASAEDMVASIDKISVEELLTQFVDLDALAPTIIGLLSARAEVDRLADGTPEKAAAEQEAKRQQEALRGAAFDVSAQQLAAIAHLPKEDQKKVLDAARARINKLLGGSAKEDLGRVAFAFQQAIARAGAPEDMRITESLAAELSSPERLARNEVAQASVDLTRNKETLKKVLQLRDLLTKAPGAGAIGSVLDRLIVALGKPMEEAEKAVTAWRDALNAASATGAPLTTAQLRALEDQKKAATEALEKFNTSLESLASDLTRAIKTGANVAYTTAEGSIIAGVGLVTGGAGLVPAALMMSLAKPAVLAIVEKMSARGLRGEKGMRVSDLLAALIEIPKENLDEGMKSLLENSPLAEFLGDQIKEVTGTDLPLLDGLIEEKIDEKIQKTLEDQTTGKMEEFDNSIADQAGSLIDQNLRRDAGRADGAQYGDSVARERRLAEMRASVQGRLDARARLAREGGAQLPDAEAARVAEALRLTLGDGDVSRLEALVTALGLPKMQQLLFAVVRDADYALLPDTVSAPLRAYLGDLASRDPGALPPGAVGGLSAPTPDSSAADPSRSSENTPPSTRDPGAVNPSAQAPERVERLEASSGRSLRGGNVAGVSDRAAARLSSLPPDQAAEVQAILHDPGVSPSARALLERGLASGYGLSELRLLRDLTVNRSDAELLAEFTALGLSQVGQVSCLPTAYQIAIAEQDPLYAYRLRQNPQAMSTQDGGGGVVFTQAEIEQLQALRERGGETSLASMPLELAKIVLPALRAKGIDPSSRAALVEVDRILASLGAPVQSGNQGLDVTQFTQDAALHQTLEA